MLTNACFSAQNNAEGLMSVEQSIKSIISKVISSKNKGVIMLHHHGNRSKIFDMKIAEPSFHFPYSLPTQVAISTPGSVNKLWEVVNESYVHSVKDQIKVMKKTDIYMPTFFTRWL